MTPTLALGHLESCCCPSALLQWHQSTRITSLLLKAAPAFSTSLNQAALCQRFPFSGSVRTEPLQAENPSLELENV